MERVMRKETPHETMEREMREEEYILEPKLRAEVKYLSPSKNNGGSTDYYKLKTEWKECADIIEARDMNYNQGNIFKSAFCFNIGRHNGTDYERELNKIIYFAERELERIKNEQQK